MAQYTRDRRLVARQAVDLDARAHVPQPTRAVAAASHQQRELWVYGDRKHSGQVAVVVPDDLHGHYKGLNDVRARLAGVIECARLSLAMQ